MKYSTQGGIGGRIDIQKTEQIQEVNLHEYTPRMLTNVQKQFNRGRICYLKHLDLHRQLKKNETQFKRHIVNKNLPQMDHIPKRKSITLLKKT